MTDEYRMFLESRRSEESVRQDVEHFDIPRWKPPVQEPDPEETDHIEHYGIPEMRWGDRRFQYKDGRLTPAGRLRYLKNGGNDPEKSDDKPKKKEPHGPYDTNENIQKKFNSNTLKYKQPAQRLPDDELNRRIKRMQMEASYNNLRKQLQPKTKAERRKEIRNQIFVATLTTAAAAIMSTVYKKTAAWMVKKATGGRINLGKG